MNVLSKTTVLHLCMWIYFYPQNSPANISNPNAPINPNSPIMSYQSTTDPRYKFVSEKYNRKGSRNFFFSCPGHSFLTGVESLWDGSLDSTSHHDPVVSSRYIKEGFEKIQIHDRYFIFKCRFAQDKKQRLLKRSSANKCTLKFPQMNDPNIWKTLDHPRKDYGKKCALPKIKIASPYELTCPGNKFLYGIGQQQTQCPWFEEDLYSMMTVTNIGVSQCSYIKERSTKTKECLDKKNFFSPRMFFAVCCNINDWEGNVITHGSKPENCQTETATQSDLLKRFKNSDAPYSFNCDDIGDGWFLKGLTVIPSTRANLPDQAFTFTCCRSN